MLGGGGTKEPLDVKGAATKVLALSKASLYTDLSTVASKSAALMVCTYKVK